MLRIRYNKCKPVRCCLYSHTREKVKGKGSIS